MNQTAFSARVIASKPLRYTPAGIPIQELELEHCSDIVEAGHLRTVGFVISAVGIGAITQELSHLSVGAELNVSGFLTAARKNSSKLVLHILQVSSCSV